MIPESLKNKTFVRELAKRFVRACRHVRAFALKGTYRGKDNLRLHLGCGQLRLASYVNIDGDPDAKADVFMDFRRLSDIIAPGTVVEILSIHSLSYLNLWQARDLLRTLHSLMKTGGRLIIELPDVGKCARKLLEAGATGRFSPEYLEGVRGFYAFGLDNLEAKRDYHPYAFGWTGWHLKQELEEAGFVDVSILEPRTHSHHWRDVRLEARRG